MFCEYCGKEIADHAYVCVGCGCLVKGKALIMQSKTKQKTPKVKQKEKSKVDLKEKKQEKNQLDPKVKEERAKIALMVAKIFMIISVIFLVLSYLLIRFQKMALSFGAFPALGVSLTHFIMMLVYGEKCPKTLKLSSLILIVSIVSLFITLIFSNIY